MNTFLLYLSLEWKRMIKSISYFLAGAIVLSVLAGTIAFSAAHLLYNEPSVSKIPVGVVVQKEDALAGKAMRMIESLDSVSSLCEFTYLEEEDGIQALKKGELFALMKLPEGLIEGILDGSNHPVTVVFPEAADLPASVFRELTEAGSSILSSSQAGIYAADEYLWQHGGERFVAQTEADLNRLFLSYALDRDVYFRKKEVSAVGEVGTTAYFMISMSVFLLLLLGIPAAPFLRPNSRVLRQKLQLLGITRGKQVLARELCLTVLFLLLSAVPVFFLIRAGYLAKGMAVLFLWCLICLTASGWIVLFYELCQNSAAAMLFLFLTTVGMAFLAGGIIPSVFLPDGLQRIGAVLPFTVWMDGAKLLVTGIDLGRPDVWLIVGKLLAITVVCFGIAVKAGEGELR